VKVALHMHGNLRRFLPGGAARMALEVEPGVTIEAVLARLGAERDTWLVAVNGVTVARDRVLAADDLLECFEPVAAG